MNPRAIIQNFQVTGILSEIYAFGNGHINDTYRVVNDDPGSPDYVLQRVNDAVFPDVGGLMQNISQVTEHVRKKSGQGEQVLALIPTLEGELFYEDGNGYWRVFEFLSGSHSYEHASTTDMAYEGGLIVGNFLNKLADLPVGKLKITIPDFHNMRFRIKQFEHALKTADKARLDQAKDPIDQVMGHSDMMCEVYDFSASGNIPLRVTHGDTKFNNILFKSSGEGMCLVDLDTVMPGYLYYDIGDAVRTGVVSAAEDEADLEKVQVDISKYKALIKGYIEATKGILTKEEMGYIPKAGPYMAFIMGVRFLTDFLSGDVYYKTKFPSHNLQRARCQLYICELLLSEIPSIENKLFEP